VIDRLGNPKAFLPQGTALSKQAQLSITCGKVSTGVYGGEDGEAEAFVASCALKGRHGLSPAVNRPSIVALGMVGEAQVMVR
jgi:hypothetical protein